MTFGVEFSFYYGVKTSYKSQPQRPLVVALNRGEEIVSLGALNDTQRSLRFS